MFSSIYRIFRHVPSVTVGVEKTFGTCGRRAPIWIGWSKTPPNSSFRFFTGCLHETMSDRIRFFMAYPARTCCCGRRVTGSSGPPGWKDFNAGMGGQRTDSSLWCGSGCRIVTNQPPVSPRRTMCSGRFITISINNPYMEPPVIILIRQ